MISARRAHREDLQRRQLLLASEIARPLQRLLRGVDLSRLQCELCAQQMCFDQILVIAQHFFEQRPGLAFEALGEHARQAELGVRIVREDLQRFAEQLRCIVVLMRLQEQARPPNARLHGPRVALREIAEGFVRALAGRPSPTRLRPA